MGRQSIILLHKLHSLDHQRRMAKLQRAAHSMRAMQRLMPKGRQTGKLQTRRSRKTSPCRRIATQPQPEEAPSGIFIKTLFLASYFPLNSLP